MLNSEPDGIFGRQTAAATKAYQRQVGLTDDGIVGRNTYDRAMQDGFDAGTSSSGDDSSSLPPKPNFSPLISTHDRQRIFGAFEYSPAPTEDNPEKIEVHGNWRSQNIERVVIPQLKGVPLYKLSGNPYTSGVMRFHRLAVPQLKALWEAWENQGLIDRVLTYGGSYNARFIRGSRRTLSNHAFGTAFDINIGWNRLGREPAPKGSQGSVVELVPIANDFGFYWGGHFKRRDGMHFEVAKILSASELERVSRKYSHQSHADIPATDDSADDGAWWETWDKFF